VKVEESYVPTPIWAERVFRPTRDGTGLLRARATEPPLCETSYGVGQPGTTCGGTYKLVLLSCPCPGWGTLLSPPGRPTCQHRTAPLVPHQDHARR